MISINGKTANDLVKYERLAARAWILRNNCQSEIFISFEKNVSFQNFVLEILKDNIQFVHCICY